MSAIAAHIRARALVQKAAELMDIDEMDITSDERDPVLSEIRYAVMRVLHDEGYGLTAIGRIMLRSHTGIYHGLKRADALMDNPYFSGFVEALR